MSVLLIDNYDSFVHNIARYIGQLGFDRQVIRHDQISIKQITQLQPSHIIISPGPGGPNDAGISNAVIEHFYKQIPILGICLGHQAIGQVFGGQVIKALRPMHGMSSLIHHQQQGLFKNLNNPLTVGRYHSLIVSHENFPECLAITAHSPENEIMALAHKQYPVFGVQFHPESILTEQGYELLTNFLSIG